MAPTGGPPAVRVYAMARPRTSSAYPSAHTSHASSPCPPHAHIDEDYYRIT